MSNLGLGVMIGMLGPGFKSEAEALRARAQAHTKITKCFLLDDKDAIVLHFEDGAKFKIWDDGQSCCESRYTTTDDVPESVVDGYLIDIEVTDAPDKDHDWGVHEVQFLNIKTSKGDLVFETHNEHNGYYGGFYIRIERIE